ncbi:MAG: sulfurtransferase complex subunit TusB [Colwellia sp.]
MSTLHIVRQSAFTSNSLKQCLQIALPGDSIVFIDDGCYCLTHPIYEQYILGASLTLNIINDHAKARGIELHKNIQAINMSDLVELTFKMDNAITWQ